MGMDEELKRLPLSLTELADQLEHQTQTAQKTVLQRFSLLIITLTAFGVVTVLNVGSTLLRG